MDSIMTDLIPTAIEAVIILSLYGAIYDGISFIKTHKLKSLIFIVFYVVMAFWATEYLPPVFHTISIFIYTILVLFLITQTEFKVSVAVMCAFTLLIMITESIIMTIFMAIFSMNIKEILDDSNINLLFVICAKLCQTLIILLLSKAKFKLINYIKPKARHKYFKFLVLQITLLSIAIISANLKTVELSEYYEYNILIFVIFFVLMTVFYFDLKDKEEISKILNRYEVQSEHIKNMEDIISLLRQERHDFNNHLCAIKALVYVKNNNALEMIKKYIDELTENLNTIKHFDTGNDYLDAFLTIKYCKARDKNIDFEVDAQKSFSLLKMPESELISIISNLIDNAMESFDNFEESESYKKRICLSTCTQNGNFIIEVFDNGVPISPEILDKVFNRGFTTKRRENGGYGLYIIKRLIKKNNGKIIAVSDEKGTTFLVKIKIK